jgi:hypothetical protein
MEKERMVKTMKKFCKFLLGLTAAAAAIGGVLYFLKNILMKDYLDDYDDDDFDNDLYEEENDERDYVKITPDASEDDLENHLEDDEDVESDDVNDDAVPDELI